MATNSGSTTGSDSTTTVETTGFLTRLAQSIVGIIIGIVLFFGSFVVLYLNEGSIDQSVVASRAAVANPTAPSAALDGKFVSLTGAVQADQPLGDTLYLKPGPFVVVQRTAEMYAWIEHSSSSTTTNPGGSTTTTTTYTYQRDWTSQPADSSRFHSAAGHENPPMLVPSSTGRAAAASVGPYHLDLSTIQVPDLDPLTLSADNTTSRDGAQLVGSQYIFVGHGAPESPQLGDERFHYAILPNGAQVTVFGVQNGATLQPYDSPEAGQMYRMFRGTRDDALRIYHAEYVSGLWIVRLVGFLMLWMGLNLVFGPLTTLLDLVPIVGSIGKAIIGALTFTVALVLTAVTVVLAILLHHPIALLIVAAVIVVGLLVLQRAKKPLLRARLAAS